MEENKKNANSTAFTLFLRSFAVSQLWLISVQRLFLTFFKISKCAFQTVVCDEEMFHQ